MEREEHDHRAEVMWAAIGVSVAAFDLLTPGETLSSCFARARENEKPLVRIAAVGALAVTAAHLMEWLPEKADPLKAFGRRYRRD